MSAEGGGVLNGISRARPQDPVLETGSYFVILKPR